MEANYCFVNNVLVFRELRLAFVPDEHIDLDLSAPG